VLLAGFGGNLTDAQFSEDVLSSVDLSGVFIGNFRENRDGNRPKETSEEIDEEAAKG